MPFMLEDVKKGGCTPVFSHSLSMGKQLTSLPMLVLLCVLKACTGRLVCVLFFTFLCFALTLHTASSASCAQDDVMGTVCLRRLNVTCFIFVQATVTRKAVSVKHLPLSKGSVTAPHNRPCFHTSYFRKHPRARGPITRQFGYGDIKITEKPGDIWSLLCC